MRAWLTLTDVVVARETGPTNDGMGGVSAATTTETTLARAAIWQAGSSIRFLSEKLAQSSTHVLCIEPSAYTFTEDDRYVTSGGNRYRINGRADNVMAIDEVTTVALELIV